MAPLKTHDMEKAPTRISGIKFESTAKARIVIPFEAHILVEPIVWFGESFWYLADIGVIDIRGLRHCLGLGRIRIKCYKMALGKVQREQIVSIPHGLDSLLVGS